MFCDWAKGKRGQILQQRHDRDRGQQESNEQWASPGGGFAFFFAANDPAMARIGIAWAKRPKNITSPVVMLYQSVFALSPTNNEPLSAALEA
jgi:hypothetical protein